MRLSQSKAEIYVPDHTPEPEALRRSTHVGIGAHQDDLEIMAWHGILTCLQSPADRFLGITVSDGAGSPRNGAAPSVIDEEIRVVRRREQRRAADLCGYAAMVQLDHPSARVQDPADRDVIEDLKQVLSAVPPGTVYTHDPADKHDTHVGVFCKTIQALRELPAGQRPRRVIGCEVWRDLDWMLDADKVVMDVSDRQDTAEAAIRIFESQTAEGKRYDLASLARRRAHAAFSGLPGMDQSRALIFGMDLTPLVLDPGLDTAAFVDAHIQRLSADVQARLRRSLP